MAVTKLTVRLSKAEGRPSWRVLHYSVVEGPAHTEHHMAEIVIALRLPVCVLELLESGSASRTFQTSNETGAGVALSWSEIH